MNVNTKQGLAPLIWIIIAAILISGGYWAYQYTKGSPLCWPYCPDMTDEDREEIKRSALEAETSNWNTYRNEEYGFEFRYPTSVQEKKSGIAELELEILSLNPPFNIGFFISRAGIGFAGWIDYRPKETVRAFDTTVTINYTQSEENPNERLFIALFEQDGRQYLLLARTNVESLAVKEHIFREVVHSVKRVVMP
jgi:hypothetical protein